METNLRDLSRIPDLDRESPFVPLPGHVEALARLVYTIEARHRLAVLSGPPGVGKSRVLAQALHDTRDPLRRVSIVHGPMEGAELFAGLARGLGVRQAVGPAGFADGWHLLERGIRIFALQGFQAVLVVDRGQFLVEAGYRPELERLCLLGELADGAATILLVTADESAHESVASRLCTLPIRVKPLTRSEADTYLAAKLAAAGYDDRSFTPRAVTRLHALSGGIPRELNRLATLALMAVGSRGVDAISAEVVDAVSEESQRAVPALLEPRFSSS